MSDEEVKKIQTSCNGCVFAKYQICEGRSIQIGCELGRLEIFTSQERVHLEEEMENFYIVDGICNTCRGETWSEAHDGQHLVAAVEREIQVAIDIVLYSMDDVEGLIEKIEHAVSACVKQKKISPKKIIVVIQNTNMNYQDLYNALQDVTEPYEIPFQLVRVVEEGADISRCVAMGIDKCTSQFTAIFDVDRNIPSNFIVNFNNVINYKLQRIIMVEPVCGYSNMILQTGIFKLLGKNHNEPIFEKAKDLAAEQETPELILAWDELWNQE